MNRWERAHPLEEWKRSLGDDPLVFDSPAIENHWNLHTEREPGPSHITMFGSLANIGLMSAACESRPSLPRQSFVHHHERCPNRDS
jgi:hypothetical protein